MVADIKYGGLAEVEDLLLRKQAEARTADRMLSDTVGPEEIATVVSKWTGVPVNKLQASDMERLSHLEEYLHERVVGQDAGGTEENASSPSLCTRLLLPAAAVPAVARAAAAVPAAGCASLLCWFIVMHLLTCYAPGACCAMLQRSRRWRTPCCAAAQGWAPVTAALLSSSWDPRAWAKQSWQRHWLPCCLTATNSWSGWT